MNLVQVQERLKLISDQQLNTELRQPDPSTQALVMAEVQRRQKMRAGAAPSPKKSIYEQMLGDQSTAASGAAPPQQPGLAGGLSSSSMPAPAPGQPPPINGLSAGVPPQGPPGMPPQPGMQSPPGVMPPMPQAGFAHGGLIGMYKGGDVPDGIPHAVEGMLNPPEIQYPAESLYSGIGKNLESTPMYQGFSSSFLDKPPEEPPAPAPPPGQTSISPGLKWSSNYPHSFAGDVSVGGPWGGTPETASSTEHPFRYYGPPLPAGYQFPTEPPASSTPPHTGKTASVRGGLGAGIKTKGTATQGPATATPVDTFAHLRTEHPEWFPPVEGRHDRTITQQTIGDPNVEAAKRYMHEFLPDDPGLEETRRYLDDIRRTSGPRVFTPGDRLIQFAAGMTRPWDIGGGIVNQYNETNKEVEATRDRAYKNYDALMKLSDATARQRQAQATLGLGYSQMDAQKLQQQASLAQQAAIMNATMAQAEDKRMDEMANRPLLQATYAMNILKDQKALSEMSESDILRGAANGDPLATKMWQLQMQKAQAGQGSANAMALLKLREDELEREDRGQHNAYEGYQKFLQIDIDRMKASGVIPTPEQITRMYNDPEKRKQYLFLFPRDRKYFEALPTAEDQHSHVLVPGAPQKGPQRGTH